MTDAWVKATPLAKRTLAPEHRRVLEEESGIEPALIEGRGYYSLDKRAILSLTQAGVYTEQFGVQLLKADGWMGIPVMRPDGQKHGEIVRVFGGTTKQKYLWPVGMRQAADVHPDYLDKLLDPTVSIIITEGVKKADAILSAARRESIDCVVLGLNGCWGWRARLESGGGVALPDFQDIPWFGRRVYIISDSDYRSNNDVRQGWNGCATYISSKTSNRFHEGDDGASGGAGGGKAKVLLVVVPPAGLDKQGADDYLVGGGRLGDLLGLGQTPQQALADTSTERPPLVVRSGRQLIEDAGQTIPHLITPLLPEQAIMILGGHTGTLKTWHALTLCLDGAFGLTWNGHPDLGRTDMAFKSIYVSKDMAGVILGQRLRTLMRADRYRTHPDKDRVLEESIAFVDEAGFDMVEEDHRNRLEDAITMMGAKVVVLDSFSMCWTGDENSNSEVGRFYMQIREISERTGCSWIIIQHLLKPQTGNKRVRPEFQVRGAGQIIQQADAAIIMSLTSGDKDAPHGLPEGVKHVSVVHAKARTSVELAPWVTKFEEHDGLYHTITYTGKLSEVKQRDYASSGGDPDKLEAWVETEFLSMPGMHHTASGLRTKQLVVLLQANWQIEGKSPPGEMTIRRAIDKLMEAGTIEKIDENRRLGNLYRLTQREMTNDALAPE